MILIDIIIPARYGPGDKPSLASALSPMNFGAHRGSTNYDIIKFSRLRSLKLI
jgi:hypothetical protein